MKSIFPLMIFGISILYCGVSNATEISFNRLDLEIEPKEKMAILGRQIKKINDDNLTADSEPEGGYHDFSPSFHPSVGLDEFKKLQIRFEKILQEIKDIKSGKKPIPTKIDEYTKKEEKIDILNEPVEKTYLPPLSLALTVFAEPEVIEWLIQSGTKLNDSNQSVLHTAISTWPNIELIKDKEKAKQIYFQNIHLLLDKKVNAYWSLDSAIFVGQYDIINLLVDNGYAKPTQQDLCYAIKYLNWETIQKILNTGLDINDTDRDYKGATPLMYAVQSGRLDIVEKLLKLGADPNKKSCSSKSTLCQLISPLDAATDAYRFHQYAPFISPNLRIVRALLKAGAKPELPVKSWDSIRDSFNKSDKILIKILIKYGAKGIFLSPTFWKMAKAEDVKTLIQNGEDVNKVGYKNWTPLMYANKYSPNPEEMISLLKENGAIRGILPWDFELELTPENIQKQIENGANPNTQKVIEHYGDLELKSPLILAIESNNVPAVKTLLENKVLLDGGEPLFYALGRGHSWMNQNNPTNLEIVKLLLDARINPNITKKREFRDMLSYDYLTSPLIIAIQKDEVELVKLLLKYGADSNQLIDGKTPLMYAVDSYGKEQQINIINILLKSGADINKQDSKGRNALFHVREKNDTDFTITELLLQNGIDVNAKDRYGNSPFMNKLKLWNDRNIQVIKKMIEMGANINSVNNDGDTVLDLVTNSYQTTPPAWQSAKKEMMDILIAKGAKPAKKRYNWEHRTSTNTLENFWHAISIPRLKEMIETKSILDTDKFTDNASLKSEEQEIISDYHEGFFVNSICSAGDNPTQQDILNATLLNAVRYQAPVEVIQYLLDSGADVNAKDTEGRTPFIWASLDNADPKTLDLLIQSGANINAKDHRGRSAIYYAVGSNNKIEFIQKLIDLGIDLQNEDTSRVTPLDYAGMVANKDENGINHAAELIRKYNGLNNTHGSMHECQHHRNGKTDNCDGFIV